MHHKKFRLATLLAVALSAGASDQVQATTSRTNAATTWIKNSADYPVKIIYCDSREKPTCKITSLIQPDQKEVLNGTYKIRGTAAKGDQNQTLCTALTECWTRDEYVIVFRGLKPDKSCYFTCA